MEFNEKLLKYRKRRGLSQTRLAELVEFDHSYVSRLESGVRMPTREAALRLSDALNLTSTERDEFLESLGFTVASATRFAVEEMPILNELLKGAKPEAQWNARITLRMVMEYLTGNQREGT